MSPQNRKNATETRPESRVPSDPLAPHTPALIQPGDLLTPAETSEILRIPQETLANWRLKAIPPLRFVKVGPRLIRYRRSDVAAFIAAGSAA